MTNLHDIGPLSVLGFFVHASNIHNDNYQTFGPFPGNPQMTYEFLRCDSDLMPADHLFSFEDPVPGGDPNRPHWTDQEGAIRNDGWRRCYDRNLPDTPGWGQFGIPQGDFWTDLFIEPRWFPDEPEWEGNTLP